MDGILHSSGDYVHFETNRQIVLFDLLVFIQIGSFTRQGEINGLGAQISTITIQKSEQQDSRFERSPYIVVHPEQKLTSLSDSNRTYLPFESAPI